MPSEEEYINRANSFLARIRELESENRQLAHQHKLDEDELADAEARIGALEVERDSLLRYVQEAQRILRLAYDEARHYKDDDLLSEYDPLARSVKQALGILSRQRHEAQEEEQL